MEIKERIPLENKGKKSKVVIVGMGNVGSTIAYTLLLRERVDELVLIDANEEKAKAQALDLNHGLPFLGKTEVWAGTYHDCKGADIIILTAGVAQKPGETRIDLLKNNIAIMDDIISSIAQFNKEAILLVVTNPVDILSYYTWKKSGFPQHKVIGSGTVLDSSRFRYLIGKMLRVDCRDVQAHIIGEHGDSSVPLWSNANLSGASLALTNEEKEELYVNTRDAAYQVIQGKGSTYYAVALACEKICTAILKNEAAVLHVSTLLTDFHGVSDVYLGVPTIIDQSGVKEIVQINLSQKEKSQFIHSADKMKNEIKRIGF